MRVSASFAAAFLALATAQLAQAADSVVQAKAQLTGLSYQLNDLTPGDNIGTSLTIWRGNAQASATYEVLAPALSGSGVSLNIIDTVTSTSTKAGFFSPVTMNASLISGEASATRDVSGAQAVVNLDSSRFADGFNYFDVGGRREGGPFVTASAGHDNAGLQLGAGTELVVTATFTLGVSVDASSLIGLTQGENLRVLGQADIDLGFTPWQILENVDYELSSFQRSLTAFQDVGPDGVLPTGEEAVQAQTYTLTAVVRNFRNNEIGFYGAWQVNALARVTPVPEASAWALLVAGLGLVSLARRRRAV